MANPWPHLTTGLAIGLSLAKEAAQTKPRPCQTTKSGIPNNSSPCLYVCVARPAHNHTMANPWCHVSPPRQNSSLDSAWPKKPHRQGRVLVNRQQAAFRTATPTCPHVCSRDLCRETRTQSHNGKPVATSHYHTTTGLAIRLSLAKEAARQGHDLVKQQKAAF